MSDSSDKIADSPVPQNAEADLRRLAAIVASSNDAIIGTTLDGIITSWNRAAELIFGYRSEEIVGRSVFLLAAPHREDEMPLILDRIKRGERIEHFETARCRKGRRPGRHLFDCVANP